MRISVVSALVVGAFVVGGCGGGSSSAIECDDEDPCDPEEESCMEILHGSYGGSSEPPPYRVEESQCVPSGQDCAGRSGEPCASDRSCRSVEVPACVGQPCDAYSYTFNTCIPREHLDDVILPELCGTSGQFAVDDGESLWDVGYSVHGVHLVLSTADQSLVVATYAHDDWSDEVGRTVVVDGDDKLGSCQEGAIHSVYADVDRGGWGDHTTVEVRFAVDCDGETTLQRRSLELADEEVRSRGTEEVDGELLRWPDWGWWVEFDGDLYKMGTVADDPPVAGASQDGTEVEIFRNEWGRYVVLHLHDEETMEVASLRSLTSPVSPGEIDVDGAMAAGTLRSAGSGDYALIVWVDASGGQLLGRHVAFVDSMRPNEAAVGPVEVFDEGPVDAEEPLVLESSEGRFYLRASDRVMVLHREDTSVLYEATLAEFKAMDRGHLVDGDYLFFDDDGGVAVYCPRF